MKENKLTAFYLNKLLEHLKFHDKLAPFPIYGSEYIKDVEDELIKIKMSKQDYDNEPVIACKYCKSLHLILDDTDNTICHRCGSVNELKEFNNIYEYQKFIDGNQDT